MLTKRTAQSWGAHKVVGVDIDDELVRAAWRRRRTVWSLQAPDNTTVKSGDAELEERPKKRIRDDQNMSMACTPSYFPASFEHTFGPVSIPPSQNRGRDFFPHNVSFRTADWVEDEIPGDKDGYDVILG